MSIGAQLVQGFSLVIEELYLWKYNLNPLYTIGFEGLFGSLIYIPVLFIFSLIKCSNDELCPDGYIDNIWIVSD